MSFLISSAYSPFTTISGSPMARPAFFYHTSFLLHTPPAGHPERPDRLRTLIRRLKETDLWNRFDHPSPRRSTSEHLLLVHTEEHCGFVQETCEHGGGLLDEGDTHCVPESFDAALLAAGSVTQAVDAVIGGGSPFAFCAVRPPGHHAERDQPMGFCLFNNVAIGARYAQKEYGLKRVAILDWDVHHGNGTQHIFENDPTVLYISLHQYPFYPGTGARDETGTGPGKGFTLNIPLPAGTGVEEYLRLVADEVVPALDRFAPDLLMISAGFDAHRDDPLGGMLLTDDSFAAMTRLVVGTGPVVSVLEGGYDLGGLSRSAEAHLRALVGGTTGTAPSR